MFHRIVKRQAMVYFFILLFPLFQMATFLEMNLLGRRCKGTRARASSLAKRSNDVFRVQNGSGELFKLTK